jgi:murein DD-endopeptidase MepM/ murein hydrolase activator NlpD
LTNWGARLITYAVALGLAAIAIAFARPLPERPSIGEVAGLSVDPWQEHVDSVGRGETIGQVFERGGLTGPASLEVIRVATGLDQRRTFDPRRIPAGFRVTFGGLPDDSIPRQITMQVGIDRILKVIRGDSGWTAAVDSIPWAIDTMVIRGEIKSNLYDALASAEGDLPNRTRTELAWAVADIFEYRIDMSRDLQVGDAFSALVERRQLPTGDTRIGNVLATTFTNGGRRIEAIRHHTEGRARYYDQDGKSLAANFLLAPLQFRRISSNFGGRRHPVLGTFRRHQGPDYAANSGTEVRAIGDGVVIAAGVRGGYGNMIDVRHPTGFVTRYGHLRGFARGVRGGTRVAMGQTIGYVGMTGLATGPHLHFEVLVNGVARNPRTAFEVKAGPPLPASERAEFDLLRHRYLALLDVRDGSRLVLNAN